jgi:hypothetical protein
MLCRSAAVCCIAGSVGLWLALLMGLVTGCDSDSGESHAGGSAPTTSSSHGGTGTAGSGGQAGGGGQAGAGAQAGSGGNGGASSVSGSIVPLYSYPTDASWDAIIAAKGAHPTVALQAIINPDSGPGQAADALFAQGITSLADAGIVVLGYVATSYAAKPAADVHAEIDSYQAWYPGVSGIFFDEMESAAGSAAYYAELTTYAKDQGFTRTVGNPGTDVDPSYVGTVDTIFIYESAGLPDVGSLGGWHTGYDRHDFGIIPYAVPSLDGGFVAQARAYVGFIYLTDDDLPNPWDTLPPYFSDLLAALE